MSSETAAADLTTITRTQVEDFLYREAELLDRWRLDDWLELFTSDGRYVIPTTDLPGGSPSRDLVLVDDDRVRLQARVTRLNSRRAHREFPHSRTSHQLSNVRLGPVAGGELPVRAEFIIWRFRNGDQAYYTGHYEYLLVLTKSGLRIREKRAVPAMTTLRAVGDVAIIL
jgi:p-cumate 2,3-dioxygenase beta subunit